MRTRVPGLALWFLFVAAAGVTSWGCGGGGDGATPTPTPPPAGPFSSPPNDTYYPQMWHLRNTGQTGPAGGMATAGEDIRAEQAWSQMIDGTGVRIVVIDNGVQVAHADLATNAAVGGHGVPDGPMTGVVAGDPSPAAPGDNHGTNVAGVAAAVGHNGIGVCGIAPRSGLVGIRDGGGVVAVQNAGMTWGLADNHVYNMSYGPTEDGTFTLTDPGEAAALTAGLAARAGRGVIYVRAAGNGGGNNHHANLDGFNNEFGVIVISGVDARGMRPAYAQEGACITACAPSSDETSVPDNLPDQLTTDVNPGGNPAEKIPGDDNYSQAFGQTSGAAPLAAGVAALILQRNPNLTWRDVRRILAFSARQNDAGNAGWVNNGAGRPVHPAYGYGVVNAGAAVTMAGTFTSLGAGTIAPTTTSENGIDVAIPDNNPAGVTRMVNVVAAQTVDQVTVRLTLTHAHLRHLRVRLTSPSGTVSDLLVPNPAVVAVMPLNNQEIKLTTLRCMGETTMGNWTLQVADEIAGTTGTLHSWSLDLYAD
jgi:subtilisin-like proprotein convertase family protein